MPASSNFYDSELCYQGEVPSSNILRTSLTAPLSSFLASAGLDMIVEGRLVEGSNRVVSIVRDKTTLA